MPSTRTRASSSRGPGSWRSAPGSALRGAISNWYAPGRRSGYPAARARSASAKGEWSVERIRVAIVCVAVLSLSFSSPAAAASGVVHDARGDLRPGLPAYLDIAQAKVTDEVGTDRLVFS